MNANQNVQPTDTGPVPGTEPRDPMAPRPMTTPEPEPERRRTSDPGERQDPRKQPEIQLPSTPNLPEIPAKPRRDLPQPDPERA
jgi:hypothetical protein